MKKILLPFFFFVCGAAVAQDIHFSQNAMAPLASSPAFCGALYRQQATAVFRDQWTSVGESFRTVYAAYDMRLGEQNNFPAFGISFFSDRAGDARMGTTLANIFAGYHIGFAEKHTLGAALSAGFGQRSINTTALQWTTQYDGMHYNASLPNGENNISEKFSYPDIGAGLAWTFRRGEIYMTGNDAVALRAGIGAWHVNRPRNGFISSSSKQDIRYTGHFDGLIGMKGTPFTLLPSCVYHLQGVQQELLLGSLVRYSIREESKYTSYVTGMALAAGAFYRNRDALVLGMQFQVGTIGFGCSYDINTSPLREASAGRGGIEISIRYLSGKGSGDSARMFN